MNHSTQTCGRRPGFTLIELLVVIAVIAILAALLFPVTAGLKRKRLIAVAYAELSSVETAIEAYKSARGTYPPADPQRFLTNQLFFELKGTLRKNIIGGPGFATLDESGEILVTDVPAHFGTGGFVNSSASASGDDEKAAAQNYLKDLKPNQSAALPYSASVKILTCSIPWERGSVVSGDTTGINPWRYVSTNPTNNPSTYDLWVDIIIGDKTNRISNWSRTPQIVAY